MPLLPIAAAVGAAGLIGSALDSPGRAHFVPISDTDDDPAPQDAIPEREGVEPGDPRPSRSSSR